MRSKRKAFMLLEVLIAVAIAMACMMAVSNAFLHIGDAQQKTEIRWTSFMACRTVLERACESLSEVDTLFIVESNVFTAQARMDSLPRGELLVSASAFLVSEGGQRYAESTLSQIIWPGNGLQG